MFRFRPSQVSSSPLQAAIPSAAEGALGALGAGFHAVTADEIERDPNRRPPRIDVRPLLASVQRATDWLLDLARSRTQDRDDLAAIARVDATARASLARSPVKVQVSEEDILTVAGILIATFEDEWGLPGLGAAIGAAYDGFDRGRTELAALEHAAELVRAAVFRSGPRSLRAVTTRAPRVAYGDDEATHDLPRIVILR